MDTSQTFTCGTSSGEVEDTACSQVGGEIDSVPQAEPRASKGSMFRLQTFKASELFLKKYEESSSAEPMGPRGRRGSRRAIPKPPAPGEVQLRVPVDRAHYPGHEECSDASSAGSFDPDAEELDGPIPRRGDREWMSAPTYRGLLKKRGA